MGFIVRRGPVLREEGTLEVEQFTTFVDERHAVEHVYAAEEEVMGVDQVIVDLRVLTWRKFTHEKKTHQLHIQQKAEPPGSQVKISLVN